MKLAAASSSTACGSPVVYSPPAPPPTLHHDESHHGPKKHTFAGRRFTQVCGVGPLSPVQMRPLDLSQTARLGDSSPPSDRRTAYIGPNTSP
jgi:hypothetical protein